MISIGRWFRFAIDSSKQYAALLKEHTELLLSVKLGTASDGHHTINELYEFRKTYNAFLFNEWSRLGIYDVHKSWRHHDGKPCFGKPNRWFVVVAQLPTGQISNHYPAKDWMYFNCPTRHTAATFDGHTPADVLTRMEAMLLDRKGHQA
jgi:hypothetical protein